MNDSKWHRMVHALRAAFDPSFDAVDIATAALHAREVRIEAMVTYIFEHVGIDIDTIYYSEASDRSCSVSIDDNQVQASAVSRLQHSGLADDYHIAANLGAGGIAMDVTFIVDPHLDDATFIMPVFKEAPG